MYGIRVEDAGTLVRVGMGGEFDACSLADLKAGLDDACGSGRPVVVDLSGVTVLDLQSTLELVVRYLIQPHLLAFANPSFGALRSVCALGLEGFTHIHPDHEEPPIFSGT